MLIEIHVLQNHAPSNLNRDDTGSPKECVFGGYKRGRISSQCLKRTVRRSDVFRDAVGQDRLATRTRRLPEIVRERLIAGGLGREVAEEAAVKASGFGTKEGKERADTLDTAQTMFLTEADITAVTETLRAAADGKSLAQFKAIPAKDLQAQSRSRGFRPVTVDVALFGRMTTSEAFRDVEAACQVAHALSTHKVDHEFDYFTAVDDLQGQSAEEEDAGADMIGDVEFNSACYYKYFSIDVDALVDNLTGRSAFRPDVPAEDAAAARDLAGRAVEAMLRAVLLTTPTGKQNSFAAHQLPSLVLVEVRPARTPVSYANAFVEPARQGRDSLVAASLEKFKRHVEALTDGFNLEASARLQFIPKDLLPTPEDTRFDIGGVERVADLSALAGRLRAAIGAGLAAPEAAHG